MKKTNITFNNIDVKFQLKDKKQVKAWVAHTINKHKRKAGEIAFVFCSDEYLLKINQEYLKHDTYTDIITFDYSKGSKLLPISGEILISIDRIKENALKFSNTQEQETQRIIIHGVLHLLGYSDKTKGKKLEMSLEEDVCLKELVKGG